MNTLRSRRGNTQLQFFFIVHFVGVSAWMGLSWGVNDAPAALSRFVDSVSEQGAPALIPDEIEQIAGEAMHAVGGIVEAPAAAEQPKVAPTVLTVQSR
jgi:hypothetical protein